VAFAQDDQQGRSLVGHPSYPVTRSQRDGSVPIRKLVTFNLDRFNVFATECCRSGKYFSMIDGAYHEAQPISLED
jgi:hypothetical protein